MRTSQSTNKMAANDGRPNMTISDVLTFFSMNTGNAIKIFDAGGRLKVTRAVPEKHIINFFGLKVGILPDLKEF